MDVAQLAVLRELAERGSVTAVAEATGRTPSAVSQQLKALQRDLGVVLVERAGRGVVLTDAGRALAAGAVDVATAIARAEAAWDAYRGAPTGRVRVATFFSAGELLLPGLLRRLAAYPELGVEICDADVAQDEFEALTADHDIVIAHRSDDIIAPERRGLQVVELLREPLDVALPPEHPLAGRSSLSPVDVIGEDWIVPPTGFPIDRVLTAIAAQAGAPPRIIQRTTHLPLAERLVEAGLGVALLPRHTTRDRGSGRFALIPLTAIRAGRYIEVLMRPDRAARQAVQVVLEALIGEAAEVVGPTQSPGLPSSTRP